MIPQYSIVTDVATEPVSYADAAAHIRVDSTDDTAYINALVSVSREYVDSVTGRSSAQQTWKLIAERWEDLYRKDADGTTWIDPLYGLKGVALSQYAIPLRKTPLVSVSSVKYYAPGASSLTTVSADDYRVIIAAEPGMIQFIDSPPDLDDRVDAIEIEFVAGSTASAIQEHAIKLMVANLYANREPVSFSSCEKVKFTLEALLSNIQSGGWF